MVGYRLDTIEAVPPPYLTTARRASLPRRSAIATHLNIALVVRKTPLRMELQLKQRRAPLRLPRDAEARGKGRRERLEQARHVLRQRRVEAPLPVGAVAAPVENEVLTGRGAARVPRYAAVAKAGGRVGEAGACVTRARRGGEGGEGGGLCGLSGGRALVST